MKPVKRIEFKVFTTDHKHYQMFRFPAPKGQTFSEFGRKQVMKDMLAFLGTILPDTELTIVQISPTRYNILQGVGNA